MRTRDAIGVKILWLLSCLTVVTSALVAARVEDPAPIEIGCALRNTGTGWYVIDDAAHHPVNCTGVIQHPTHLELLHPVGATEVITLAVTVDEAYAKAALRAGASAGLDHSYIYLYRGIPDSAPRDPATIKTPTGNLWVQGWMQP
jgi:hypothetical protein